MLSEQSSKRSWLTDIIILFFGIALIYGMFLGSRPLSVPDESRYSEIPREMLELNDFVTPHFDYVKYFEKPPLVYWLQAGSLKAFGNNIWAARVPTALMGLLGCIFTYCAGRVLFNRRMGILSAIILASSLLYFLFSHAITLDMTLSTMLAGCLFSFICAVQFPPGTKRRILCYSAYIFAALAVLTKGLVGVIFPGMVIFAWMLLSKRFSLLKSIYLPTGILLFLAIILPWHILVQIRNPEFFRFYILDQQFLRYFTKIAHRAQPVWFFIPVLLAGLLPWTFFFPQAIIEATPRNLKECQDNPNILFLLLWFIIIFVFFSLSHSKLIPYILPIFPALAIILANYLLPYFQDQRAPANAIKWGYSLIPIIVIPATILGYILARKGLFHIPSIVANKILFIGFLWSLGSLISTGFAIKTLYKKAFMTTLITIVLVYFSLLQITPLIDTRGIKPLADILNPLLKPGDEVISNEHFYQDLPFYVQQRVTIVDWSNELTFGMQHQDTSAWMISPTTFIQRWQSTKPVYVVTGKSDYQNILKLHSTCYLLGETADNILISNHPTGLSTSIPCQ